VKNDIKLTCILLGILLLARAASAGPTPVWSSSLDDAASITDTGGTIVGTPTFAPGYNNNAFTGSGSAYAVWNNAAVANIFDTVWNNASGSTIDLYFRGSAWSTMSGDCGLFGIWDRLSGNDGFYLITVRNGALRMPYRSDTSANPAVTYLDTVRLTDNVTYHLTVAQQGSALNIYLNTLTPYATLATTETYVFPSPNTIEGSVLASAPGGRAMTVGLKPYTDTSTYLPAGAWVDEVAVYNGFYSPSEIPEPGSLALLGLGFGCVALLRRKGQA
jgi:hypothetical protein